MSDSQNRPKLSKEARRLAEHKARLGQVIANNFELTELLGYGGMGAVYKARHLSMDRFVAVKFLLPEVAEDPDMRNRFLREATASGKINHPNVVQLIDYGEGAEGDAFIVIEFLDGVGLDQIIKNERQVEWSRAVNIFEQICAGVGKAHARNIIHRDLKPSNVMLIEELGERDFVKIVDFGLAKALDPSEESQRLTQSGEVFGSPIYMSPEQCMGQQLDTRADIYALGVLMYETLMGKPPFVGAVMAETIARQLQDTPKPFAEMRPDLQIPRDLEAVVMKALAKDPDERQATMQVLMEELGDTLLPKLQAKTQRTMNATGRQSLIDLPVQIPQGSSTVKMPSEGTQTFQTGTRKLSNQTRVTGASTGATTAAPPAVPSKVIAYAVFSAVAVLLAAGVFLVFSGKPAAMNGGSNTSSSGAGSTTSTSPHTSQNNSASSGTGSAQNGSTSIGSTQNSSASAGAGSAQNSSASAGTGSAQNSSTSAATGSAQNSSASAATGSTQNTSSSRGGISSENLNTSENHNESHSSSSQIKTHKISAHTMQVAATKIHKTHVKSTTAKESTESVADNSEPEPSHKRHHDWQDFSSRYEKKDSYANSWSVPMAGSKSQN